MFIEKIGRALLKAQRHIDQADTLLGEAAAAEPESYVAELQNDEMLFQLRKLRLSLNRLEGAQALRMANAGVSTVSIAAALGTDPRRVRTLLTEKESVQ